MGHSLLSPWDFTPVCTVELGRAAKLASEFAKRNIKLIALSNRQCWRPSCLEQGCRCLQWWGAHRKVSLSPPLMISIGPSSSCWEYWTQQRRMNRACLQQLLWCLFLVLIRNGSYLSSTQLSPAAQSSSLSPADSGKEDCHPGWLEEWGEHDGPSNHPWRGSQENFP